MGRPPCCDKLNVTKGLWTKEEDAKLLVYVSTHETGNWTSVPKKAASWLLWCRWSTIAQQLPGRTDNDVKNYWNTKLRKKLSHMGIDPVTHKPFSQILVDYGNIGGLPKGGTRIGSLNRDLRNAFMTKSEQSTVTHDGFSNIKSNSTMSVMSPIMEQFQDNPLNNYNTDNHSLELLVQLQAIKLITEASNCNNQETIQPHFFSEGCSSSSSSSSNAIQASSPLSFPCQQPSPLQTAPSSPFKWSEFLLDDVFLGPNPQRDFQGLSSTGSSIQIQNEILQSEFTSENEKNFNGDGDMNNGTFDYTGQGCPATGRGEASDVVGASSSSDNSFVDAILDQDSKMLWEFPDLLEEQSYY
ncbi:hypothetical protein HHK36_015243 [Tetracentron sinense]|uniref:Uncharacterized protein n=1 Tax=Tetracentron sinense TaxID=13715 RepID=A0A835DCL5_TETSI|nr:hypothetical protein HHK36_015243 [Tetracentron sinense]